MWRTIALFVVQGFLVSAGATEPSAPACEPVYKPVFKSCVNSSSPTVVEDQTTDWILTNQGADDVTRAICEDGDKIGAYAAAHPEVSNIRYKDIKAKKNLKRGIGKSDVYCMYTVSKPVKKDTPSEECGISSIERSGCEGAPSIDFVKKCVGLPTRTLAEAWIKSGCLLDTIRQGTEIQGLTKDLYSEVVFQLDVAKRAYQASPNEEYRALGRYLNQSTN